MYSSSNMLRARKKDASFKPNRILDKKSSRGMLYENEELRLRTIHINDEVERGHHDIKKLKKENDHLKREIWYLRDEYEKMEQKFNKVIQNQDAAAVAAMGFTTGEGEEYGNYDCDGQIYDENGSCFGGEDGSPPQGPDHNQCSPSQQIPNHQRPYARQLSRKVSTATTTGSANSMYSSEDEELNFMLMIDDDMKSSSGNSCAGTGMQQIQQQFQEPVGEEYQMIETEVESHCPVSVDAFPSTSTSAAAVQGIPYADDGLQQQQQQQSDATVYNPQTYHHFWHHMTSVPPELEDVKEETESTNNNSSPMPKANGIIGSAVSSPSPNASDLANVMVMDSFPENGQQLNSSSPNPIIEITPATSPNQTSSNTSFETVVECTVTEEVESETSEIQVNTSEKVEEKKGVQDLGCFALIPEKFQVSSIVKLSSEGGAGEAPLTSGEPDSKNSSCNEIHRTQTQVRTKSANAKCSTAVAHRKRRRSSARRESAQSSASQTLRFPQRLWTHSPFPTDFSQSEPSLYSHGHGPVFQQDDDGCTNGRKYYDSSARMNYHACCHSSSIGWSTGDKNVVIGYVEDGPGSVNYELRALGVKEIIDQLESQFDPKLENISSVRVMSAGGSTRIFIILKTASALKLLLEKGLSLSLSTEQQKIPIRLIDAASESSTVVLAGLPPEPLLDSAIISFLNQYGQVVGPLERRLYKGIDISECQIQIHLVKQFPSVIAINGYEIQAKICHKQAQELNADALSPGLTTTTVVCRPSVVVVQESGKSCSNSSAPPVYQPPPPPASRIPRILQQASPGPPPAPSPNATPHQTPVPQVKGGHVAVRRSVSSAPRLESAGGLYPNNAAKVPARKVGVCQDVLEEDLIQQLQLQQQQQQSNSSPKTRPQQMHSHGGSSQNLNSSAAPSPVQQQQTNYVKKPLTRLPVSSPGNLIPDSPQQQQQQQLYQQHQYGSTTGIPTSAHLTSKPFYRSMSFDPRRNSSSSMRQEKQQQQEQQQLAAGMGRMSLNDGQGPEGSGGTPSMNRRMYQPQLSHSSQLVRNGNSKLTPTNSGAAAVAAAQNDAHKPLPWCGCWGNGCL